MIIKKDIADVDGKTVEISKIFYADGEVLPAASKGSIAYCYKGAAKGKVKICDGESWEEQ